MHLKILSQTQCGPFIIDAIAFHCPLQIVFITECHSHIWLMSLGFTALLSHQSFIGDPKSETNDYIKQFHQTVQYCIGPTVLKLARFILAQAMNLLNKSSYVKSSKISHNQHKKMTVLLTCSVLLSLLTYITALPNAELELHDGDVDLKDIHQLHKRAIPSSQ